MCISCLYLLKGYSEIDRTIRGKEQYFFPGETDAEGTEELSIWFPQKTSPIVLLLHKVGGTMQQGISLYHLFLICFVDIPAYCNTYYTWVLITVCFVHVQILLPSRELKSKLRQEVEDPYQVCVCVYACLWVWVYTYECVCLRGWVGVRGETIWIIIILHITF